MGNPGKGSRSFTERFAGACRLDASVIESERSFSQNPDGSRWRDLARIARPSMSNIIYERPGT